MFPKIHMSSAVLYSNAVNLANEIHQQILLINTTNNLNLLQNTLNSLNRLDTLIEDLLRLGKNQIQQEKREIIQKRVHQLRLDYSQIKDELEQLKMKKSREREESKRKELFENTNEIVFIIDRNIEGKGMMSKLCSWMLIFERKWLWIMLVIVWISIYKWDEKHWANYTNKEPCSKYGF